MQQSIVISPEVRLEILTCSHCSYQYAHHVILGYGKTTEEGDDATQVMSQCMTNYCPQCGAKKPQGVFNETY